MEHNRLNKSIHITNYGKIYFSVFLIKDNISIHIKILQKCTKMMITNYICILAICK